jgi:PAS domain S-box-containing protein
MSIKFPLHDESGSAEVCGISSDITERKKAEETLRASEELLRAVTDNSPDAIYVKDSRSRWLMANPAVLRVVGRTAEQALGKTDLDLYADAAVGQAIIENDRRVLESGHTESFEEVADTPDGRRTFLSVKAPRRDAQGNIVGIIGISHDITERKRAEEALRESESRLAAANKELETFNYTVAHDLRAPLRHIHGFAEMLAQEAEPVLNEDAQRYLQVIRESVERMGLLLQELLNLSRLGRQELRRQPCDLHLLVQQILAELQPDLADRAIEWRITGLPTLECDPTLVRQVLWNLMANAVKFTRRRSPAVIEIAQTLHNGVPAVLVRDNGEGFDMNYADKLFGVFQRLHRKEDFEGTGVGLAIVQRIIHKHGGVVWAEAELGRGATFYFTLQSSELAPRRVA